MFKYINKSHIYYLILAVIIISLTGCATIPTSVAPTIKPDNIPGTFHKIEKGQTLWRISQIYNIDIDDLIQVNHISDSTKIETGQLILIPKYLKKESVAIINYPDSDFSWPLKGQIIGIFGQTVNNMLNKGINIKPYSDNSIKASRSGKVVFCNPKFNSFGKTIIIDHGDGFSTVYTRSSEVFVKTGDSVQKGAVIAKAGSSGRDKNTYLHFEIRKGAAAQNPYFYLSD